MQRRDLLKTLLLALVPSPVLAAKPSVSTLIGTGSAGYSDQQVNNPYGLVIGPDGASISATLIINAFDGLIREHVERQ